MKTNELIIEKCNHEDKMVTYCQKCKRFYMVEDNGDRVEIDIGEVYMKDIGGIEE